VFPKPVWKLRWRLRMFELCVIVNKYFELVPRRKEFSLLAQGDLDSAPVNTVQPSMA
jgi:hypothetical protein